ncbi:hypothetical protein PMAYCL1PPCAC_00274, partial [Pristionchus mayeri]
FTASLVLLALFAAVALVDHSDACAPAAGGGGAATTAAPKRRKRSAEEDVEVVVVSTEAFDLARNEVNMKKVEQKLKQFASKEGLSYAQLQHVASASENVG